MTVVMLVCLMVDEKDLSLVARKEMCSVGTKEKLLVVQWAVHLVEW